jgi:hypothetical protein
MLGRVPILEGYGQSAAKLVEVKLKVPLPERTPVLFFVHLNTPSIHWQIMSNTGAKQKFPRRR